jgi:hypothetical protein
MERLALHRASAKIKTIVAARGTLRAMSAITVEPTRSTVGFLRKHSSARLSRKT